MHRAVCHAAAVQVSLVVHGVSTAVQTGPVLAPHALPPVTNDAHIHVAEEEAVPEPSSVIPTALLAHPDAAKIPRFYTFVAHESSSDGPAEAAGVPLIEGFLRSLVTGAPLEACDGVADSLLSTGTEYNVDTKLFTMSIHAAPQDSGPVASLFSRLEPHPDPQLWGSAHDVLRVCGEEHFCDFIERLEKHFLPSDDVLPILRELFERPLCTVKPRIARFLVRHWCSAELLPRASVLDIEDADCCKLAFRAGDARLANHAALLWRRANTMREKKWLARLAALDPQYKDLTHEEFAPRGVLRLVDEVAHDEPGCSGLVEDLRHAFDAEVILEEPENLRPEKIAKILIYIAGVSTRACKLLLSRINSRQLHAAMLLMGAASEVCAIIAAALVEDPAIGPERILNDALEGKFDMRVLRSSPSSARRVIAVALRTEESARAIAELIELSKTARLIALETAEYPFHTVCGAFRIDPGHALFERVVELSARAGLPGEKALPLLCAMLEKSVCAASAHLMQTFSNLELMSVMMCMARALVKGALAPSAHLGETIATLVAAPDLEETALTLGAACFLAASFMAVAPPELVLNGIDILAGRALRCLAPLFAKRKPPRFYDNLARIRNLAELPELPELPRVNDVPVADALLGSGFVLLRQTTARACAPLSAAAFPDEDVDDALVETLAGTIFAFVLPLEQRLAPVRAPGRGTRVTTRIDRQDIIASALSLLQLTPSQLRAEWRVEFVGESAIDVRGCRKDLVASLSEALQERFFEPTADGFVFSKSAGGDVRRLFGILVGKALREGCLLSFAPALTLFKALLDVPIGAHDMLRQAPSEYATRVRWVSTASEEDLCAMLPGQGITITGASGRELPLVEGGREIRLSSLNASSYANLVLKQFAASCSADMGPARQGFRDVVGPALQGLRLAPAELQRVVCGAGVPTPEEFLAAATFRAVEGGDEALERAKATLAAVLADFSEADMAALLRFVTGMERAPVDGLTRMDPPLSVHVHMRTEALPSASTCFNLLKLPAYQTADEATHKLRVALGERTLALS